MTFNDLIYVTCIYVHQIAYTQMQFSFCLCIHRFGAKNSTDSEGTTCDLPTLP